jgi:bacteriorhodopsin
MSPKQLRSLGIILGLISVFLIANYIVETWETGTTNWYYLAMGCGMLLLLFYTVFKPTRRKPRP